MGPFHLYNERSYSIGLIKHQIHNLIYDQKLLFKQSFLDGKRWPT